jgi:Domain of unknown function (DUF4412)
MKKSLSLFSFLLFINVVFAQKTLKEGTVTYGISDVNVKNGKNASAAKMMNSSEITMFFAENKQKVSMTMMNGMLKTQMFMNPKEKTMRSFMDMMGRQVEMVGLDSSYRYGIEHPTKTTDKAQEPKATGKSKTILGYKCDEYIVKSKSKDKEMTTSMYVTKELMIDKELWKGNSGSSMMPIPDASELNGTPMEINMETEEMSMKMTITKIEEKVDRKEFIAPEGYKKMDINSMKGMRGGF